MEDLRKGTETLDKDGLEIIDWTIGQADWRAGRKEKSKLGMERSRKVVERIGMAESVEPGTETPEST